MYTLKVDLSVSDDEEFNNALNNIKNTLTINPPEILDGENENEIPSIHVKK